MTIVIGRSGWGALPPNRDPGVMTRCTAIVLHHTVTAQAQTIDEAKATVLQIDREHLAKTEPDGRPTYSDIAYNLVAGPNCVLVGRGPTANDGATDNDAATDTVSIAVLGDYRDQLVTGPYRAAIDAAVKLCRDIWGPIPVRPHHDYYNTICPGHNLDLLIPQLNEAPDMDQAEYFDRPIKLVDDKLQPTYDSTTGGWMAFVHQELKMIRLLLDERLPKN